MTMKQKRKPGAGRKPTGPFAHNNAQLTIRMPDDLREQLERSANKRGWSLSQELLMRLHLSYAKQREERERRPATRALCFLIGELARRLGFFDGWHRSPFVFRTFRLSVAQLLETLEPTGDADNPYEPIIENFRKFLPDNLPDSQVGQLSNRLAALLANGEVLKSPEALADVTAKKLMEEVVHPDLREDEWKQVQKNHPDPRMRGWAEAFVDHAYTMANVRRDLSGI